MDFSRVYFLQGLFVVFDEMTRPVISLIFGRNRGLFTWYVFL